MFLYSAILRKKIVQSCDTQFIECDCDVVLIINELFLIIIHSMCVLILFIIYQRKQNLII